MRKLRELWFPLYTRGNRSWGGWNDWFQITRLLAGEPAVEETRPGQQTGSGTSILCCLLSTHTPLPKMSLIPLGISLCFLEITNYRKRLQTCHYLMAGFHRFGNVADQGWVQKPLGWSPSLVSNHPSHLRERGLYNMLFPVFSTEFEH